MYADYENVILKVDKKIQQNKLVQKTNWFLICLNFLGEFFTQFHTYCTFLESVFNFKTLDTHHDLFQEKKSDLIKEVRVHTVLDKKINSREIAEKIKFAFVN